MLSIMKRDKPLYTLLTNEVKEVLLPLEQILCDQLDDVWLVGGTIRDLLEGETPRDFDFAFAGDLTGGIKRWASQQGGHWFWLDEVRNQSRVLFTDLGLQFDFAPLRAENIYADLKLRDFTLNAMALTFRDLSAGEQILIDPLGGRKDLEAKILRSCGPGVISDDPLRALKGVRHHALRGWQFDPQTAIQVRHAAPLLAAVAGERIRNELAQILASPRPGSALALMERVAILDNLFPGFAPLDLALELELLSTRFCQLEQVPRLASLLEQPIEEGLTRKTLLILAALLRRVDPWSAVEQITQRLRLSTRSRAIVCALYGQQVSLDDFSATDSSRIAALKLEALGKNCLERILSALASLNQQDQDRQIANYCEAYSQRLVRGRISDLLDGREIVFLAGLSPGKIIGDYQTRIKAAEIAGEISDKATAESWLIRQFSD